MQLKLSAEITNLYHHEVSSVRASIMIACQLLQPNELY